MSSEFWLCFVPLFVAVDPLGVLPIFHSLTTGLSPQKLRSVVLQSMITAAGVSVVFLFAGKALLAWLGITIPDFMIAGGFLLFALSLGDLLTPAKAQRRSLDVDSLGAVPIGVPLIAGPALLTTTLMQTSTHSHWIVLAALLVNILLAGLCFNFSTQIAKILGNSGARITSKIASLVMAAFAVMMVRKALQAYGA